MAPLISVLLTSYNRERYLAESIESVLRQTLMDFELVISDNCSTDRSLEIARDYAASDQRIRVSVNDRNVGQFQNRRRAAELARGEYLKYHDSDDVMYPHCLAVMVDALQAAPTAAFALSGAGAWPGGPAPMLVTPRLAYEREFLGSGMFQLGPAAALFRTDAFRRLGGFPDAGAASDYLFWLKSCAVVDVLLVSADLFYYRWHPGQELVRREHDLSYAQSIGYAWQMLNSNECPLAGTQLTQAKRNFVFAQVRGIYRLLKQRRVSTAAANFRHSRLGPTDWLRYLRVPKRNRSAGTPVVKDRA
jgi:glycosyltransferase involved in cell wall biosynthesis